MYEADFRVGNKVIDIKGMATPLAKMKRKMFMYKYPYIELQRLVRYKGEWIDYFENEKRKRQS